MAEKRKISVKDKATIDRIAASLNCDILCYTRSIAYPYDCFFVSKVREMAARRPNVLLVLTTNGGSADAAYRMMRLLQHFYRDGKIFLLVIDRCKSAGTLVAVGADEIIMVDDAELGPLDVQVLKPDELGEYTSGLTAYQALTALRSETFQSFEEHFIRLRRYSGYQITTRTAADIAAKLATGGVQKLYEQLDPMRIAEHQRAMTIAEEYGIRLNRQNLKPEALDRLIADYPSHGFLIDYTEARTLFSRVRLPTAAEQAFCVLLLQLGLCHESPTAPAPTIILISEEFEATPADKKKGAQHAKTIRNPRKAAAETVRDGVPADGQGDAEPHTTIRAGMRNGR